MHNLLSNRPGGERLRVLLADDHPMILDGLVRLLEPELEIVAQAPTGPMAVELTRKLLPDLAIVDISMPGYDGIEVTRRMLEVRPEIKVLILSIHQEASWVRAAFDAGAAGYLCKTAAASEIELAVREVISGNVWISPAVARAALQPVAAAEKPAAGTAEKATAEKGIRATVDARGESLTPREIEILDLLALSLGNKEIAHHLGVSVTTVRTHLSSIYEKLGVDSRVGLALYAAQIRLSAS